MLMRSIQINSDGEDYFANVCDFITDGSWDISAEFSEAFPEVADYIW